MPTIAFQIIELVVVNEIITEMYLPELTAIRWLSLGVTPGLEASRLVLD